MSSFTLGNAPLTFSLNLNERADFISTITTASGDDWPTGTVVTLEFSDDAATIWPATVAGPVLSWDVDKVAVGVLYDAKPASVQLRYAAATGEDDLWASGRVSRNA